MNSELDRTHTPFDDNPRANAEFEAWLDETLRPTTEQIAAEDEYWERW